MTDRVHREIELLKNVHSDVEVGSEWIILEGVSLPDGWNQSETDLLIKIPSGYPTTPPDNFYAEPNLRLEDGSKPENVPNQKSVGGRDWLEFSYHLQNDDWDPHTEPERGHNLTTYLDGVKKRFSNPT